MTLYEIDSNISTLLSALEPDENGMLPENCDELFQKLQDLDMQRQKKLENVARYILNIRYESSVLEKEEKRLAARRKVLENKETHLMKYLDGACEGKKTNLGIATFCYRKSERVEVTDINAAIKFLQDNKYTDCIRTKDPEIAKDEVKALIKKGTKVPGAEIVAGLSYSLR